MLAEVINLHPHNSHRTPKRKPKPSAHRKAIKNLKVWGKRAKMSLKAFMRKQATSGNEHAQAWLRNKGLA